VVALTEAELPPVRIVRGNPTAEELAAVTALMAVAGGTEPPAPRTRRGGWNDPSWQHRRELIPGPNAWRASARQ
jgi:hypothetical protein